MHLYTVVFLWVRIYTSDDKKRKEGVTIDFKPMPNILLTYVTNNANVMALFSTSVPVSHDSVTVNM